MSRLRALVLALVLMLAGCGGDSKKSSPAGERPAATSTAPTAAPDAYRTDVTRILGVVGAAGSALGASAQGRATPQERARALDGFQGKVMRAADDLDALQPPAKVAAAHRDLVQIVRDIADSVQPAIDQGRAGDVAGFRSAARAFESKLDSSLRPRLTQVGRRIDAGLAGT
jgi:hypothetical protein